MFSRQEHHTEDQVICWNCEEAVHQSVLVCPYCNVDIHRHHVQKAPEQQKITPLSQSSPTTSEPLCNNDSPDGAMQTLRFLCSLFLLLAGSALFFLAVIIAFFAHDGAFTISWQEHTWSAFFGLGLSLLAFGTFFLQKLSSAAEESS
jgi:hypothetical protein